MSNKHWCMPDYMELKRFRAVHSELDGLTDIDAVARCFGVLGVEPSKSPVADLKVVKDFYFQGRSPDSLAEIITATRKQEALAVTKDEVHLLLIESWLLHKKSPCLFIENMELLRFLYESTYTEDTLQIAIEQNEFNWFCFPSRSLLGLNLRPCVFGKIHGKCICRIYLSNHNTYESLVNLESAASQFVLSKNNNTCDFDDMNTRAAVRLHLRLCLAAVVYSLCFPDYIRDGLPYLVKAPDIRSPRILTAAPEILEGATRTSVSMHIRAGHFRCLRDERYKRNEDGTPKIVFVRQTVVAGKLTPKTAVGL